MDDKNEKIRLRDFLTGIAATAAVICIIVLFFFKNSIFSGAASRVLSIMKPFIWGGVIAYLLVPVCRALEKFFTYVLDKGKIGKRQGIIRLISVILSIVFLLLLIIFLVMAVLPEVVTSISGIIAQIPGAVAGFQKWIEGLGASGLPADVVETIETAVATVTDKISTFLSTDFLPFLKTLIPNVTSSFLGIVDVVKNFGLGCIISAYLMSKREKFAAQAKMSLYAIVPEKNADWIMKEVRYADSMFSGFIRGNLLDSLLIGLLCFVFMLIARMPYAVLVSIVVGVANLIPFFGPYIGAIPSAILILTVSPVKCIIFVVFILLLQQLDGNFIVPKILGNQLGLDGFWILFSILVFGSLWGFVGMLIGVPVFAVLYDIIRNFVFSRLKRCGKDDMASEYREVFPAAAGDMSAETEAPAAEAFCSKEPETEASGAEASCSEAPETEAPTTEDTAAEASDENRTAGSE